MLVNVFNFNKFLAILIFYIIYLVSYKNMQTRICFILYVNWH